MAQKETEKNKRHEKKSVKNEIFSFLFNDPCECPNNPNSSNINLLSLKILLPFKRFITEEQFSSSI